MLNTNWSEILKSDLDKLSPLAAIPGKVPIAKLKEGERRIVTVLFLDIQGFTAMSEMLDPEDVQLIIDNCFKILTNEVEKYRGYIDKYEGDRMMALFGSREASEQDCERALRAALGMKEKFTEVNKILADRNIKIGVRIGVNTGLVVTGRIGKGRDQDFTVMGDAVNLASRLETAAPAGEILVSDEVRRAAEDVFLYESLGKIDVKGKSEPIPVYVIRGLNPARSERWERSPFTRRSRYVSREAEDSKLLCAARRMAHGKGIATIAIRAPTGAGKSRLVHEFLRTFRPESGELPWALRGAATASHQLPYQLFSQPLVTTLADKELAESVFNPADPEQRTEGERLKPVVEYLAGQREPDERMRSLEPAALRLEIHLALRFVLERMATLGAERKTAPLILYLDGLQWADHASIEALEFLGANLTDVNPILFIWTHRPDFKLKPGWKVQFHIEEMELRPLTESECAQIVQSVLAGSVLSDREQAILIRRSGGNPFFMEELIQSLIDSEVLVRDGERWVLARPIEEASLPDTVQRILVSRIDKLDQEHKEVLMAAAVVGDDIPISVVELVGERMGFGKEGTRERLQTLEDLGFIYRKREEGLLGSQLSFRHTLTRDVVYSMILNHNKKILHGLVGEAFAFVHGERAEDHAPLLFHHFVGAGMVKETLQYGFAALDQMVRQYATKEGLEAIRILCPLLDGSAEIEQPLRLKERLLEAEIKLYDFLGQREEHRRCIEALEEMAKSHPRPDLTAKVSLYRSSYCSSVGDFRQTKEHALRGLAELCSDPGQPRLQVDLLRILGIACYSIGEPSEALDHYRRGLEIAEKLGDRNAEGAFYNATGLVYFNIGRPQEARDFYEKANVIMRQIGDRRGEGNTLGNQGLVHWTLGDYSLALEQLQESHTIFKEIGFKNGQAVTLANIGVIYQKFGQYAEALRCYERALALRREIRDRAGEGHDLVNIGDTYKHLGDFQKAVEYFDAGRALAQEVGSNYLLAESLNCLGIVYRKLGEDNAEVLARAREYAEEALSVASAHRLVAGEVKASSNLGRVYWLLGEREKGLEFSFRAMRLIAAHASGVEGSEEDAYVNHYTLLWEAGRKEEALETLETAVRLIKTRAVKIKEEPLRRSFLEEVRQNRFALEEWRKHAD